MKARKHTRRVRRRIDGVPDRAASAGSGSKARGSPAAKDLMMTLRPTALAAAVTVAVLAALSTAAGRAQTGQVPPSLAIESVAGRDNFDRYCAPCHGRDGRGAGPVAAALRTRPPDLTSLARRNDGLFPRQRVVEFVTGTGREIPAHGSAEMPIWGPIFRGLDPLDARVKQRIENIVAFIQSLQVPSTGVDAREQQQRNRASSEHPMRPRLLLAGLTASSVSLRSHARRSGSDAVNAVSDAGSSRASRATTPPCVSRPCPASTK